MIESPPSASVHVWNDAALLSKAMRYVEEMLRYSLYDDWQFAFWSSLALELIARASLAKISPALLADSNGKMDAAVFCTRSIPQRPEEFVPKSIGIGEVLTRLRPSNPKFEKRASRLLLGSHWHAQRRSFTPQSCLSTMRRGRQHGFGSSIGPAKCC